MNFEVEQLKTSQLYNLLIGLVAPRPIAWVTTLNDDDTVNAAPFSAYNYVSIAPPLIVLGIAPHPTKGNKDTLRNIQSRRNFVVNVVDECHLAAMNITATEFDSGVSEIDQAQLALAPSLSIETPRIASVPAALECQLHEILEVEQSHVVIGRVCGFYVQDEFVDPAGPYIRSEAMHAVGRMNGLGAYVKTRDAFLYQARYESAEAFETSRSTDSSSTDS